MKKLLLLFFLLISLNIQAQDDPLPYVPNYGAPNLTMFGGENQVFSLSEMVGKKSVLVLLSPDCPLSQKYTLILKKLQTDFKDVRFYAVFPGEFYSDSDILKFKEKYKLNFIFLRDRKMELVHKLGATITPEVFVLTGEMKVVYSGAIDNWYVSLGKKREVITEQYLSDALTALIAGKEISVKNTKAIGCFIERK